MRIATITFANGQAHIRQYERTSGHAAGSFSAASNATSVIDPPIWRMIASLHLCGTDPRWCHFFKASSRTPRARAASSMRVQLMSSMGLDSRDRVSLRQGMSWSDIQGTVAGNVLPMPRPLKNPPASTFASIMCARAKAIRERSGTPGQTMARYLGVDYDTYKKWEYRTPMPHKHIELFCAICNTSAHELYTGEQLPVALSEETIAAIAAAQKRPEVRKKPAKPRSAPRRKRAS